ncbi:coenzyme F420-0:L-glutamate ligase [Sphingomonas sp. LaA6.9]|uniref:coenzyme F420-0:L-glutamate ligase n=1 Tax=Sphingomonas sp. LaA6.9 TaxID=2919914 RepID=UPI001F5013B7|nr:coenzyme F420-0:L-glutamate ligase [Sphingomonas sp. LaA6.9]MCJ8156125.1 coenzyme F420-0:L-glutamate ligase [Sphingomonas sp. LaA6.9]
MIEIRPVPGIGEIENGEDLGRILGDALASMAPESGDFLVVTQKVVSKAEGQMVALEDVIPGPRATEIAGAIGKDPRLVELVLAEAVEVLRAERGVIITRHRLGLVMANSGIDCSNVGPGSGERALLLPRDPDASAGRIADAIEARCGVRPGVVISDSFGRPWRNGVVNVAVGCSGVPSLHDKRGETDRDGRTLQATLIAYGDLIASAAGLAMGEADEGVPAVLISGLVLPGTVQPASALVRAVEEDLFR